MLKKVIIRLIALAVLAGAGYYGYRFFKQLPERQQDIATARVQRGDITIRAYTRGELHAVRSVTLMAPNLFGTVQITALAPVGALAKEKDLIIEYDDSERQAQLEENRLSVQQVDENIKQLKASQAIQSSQDNVSLLAAKYAVRRAELDRQRNPVLAKIDGQKNVLNLNNAQRALSQLEIDAKSRQEQFASQLAVYREQRNRSMMMVTQELQRIAQTRQLASITGLVAIRQNRAGDSNFGQQVPEIREGDTLQPGMAVADLLDLSEVEVWAKVGELDRANLTEGQETTFRLDSIPGKQFRGTIKALSGTAAADFFSGDPSKKFDVVFGVDMRQLLAGVGMKPADIDGIMATAAANAKKVGKSGGSALLGQPLAGQQGGQQQAGVSGQAGMEQPGQGDQANGQEAAAGGRGGRAGRAGGRGGMSDQDREKMRQLMQQAQKASPEERQKLMEQLAQLTGGRGGRGGRGGQGGSEGASESASESGVQPREGGRQGGPAGGGRQGEGGGGRQGRGQAAAEPGSEMVGRVGDNTLNALISRYTSSGYTEEERNNAKLPLPPQQDSLVQALLRPGLLTDVEIVVEKIPNALHIPAQAVFQKGGHSTVYVQDKNGRFAPREVQLYKQSESTMVVSAGLKPGEVVALADPTLDKSKRQKNNDKKSPAGNKSSGPGGK